jgi:hypothetical protein
MASAHGGISHAKAVRNYFQRGAGLRIFDFWFGAIARCVCSGAAK